VAVTGVGNIIVEASGVENVVISGGAGNDTINASGLIAGLTQLTINGGAGDDMIVGSQGADLLQAGSGDDTVIGGRGNDTALLGSGNDTFIWNPGDGSDVVEGQGGFDTLLFNGANVAEHIDISANGSRALFTRDVANIAMDLNGIERIQFNALGGADNIVVNDLSGTDVKQVAIDLAGTLGGVAGDGADDTVTVNGNGGNNQITVTAQGSALVVSGLSAQVTVDHAEAGDRLIVNGGAGNDAINASAVPAGTALLTLAGGAGHDVLIGSPGNDTFLFAFGEGGRDVVKGFQVHGASAQGDVVALSGFADQSFAQALADGHIAQSGADVAISDGTHVVATLQNVLLASLHANDFIFS
jgi:Ca2+-binding RTX toxin-like protein